MKKTPGSSGYPKADKISLTVKKKYEAKLEEVVRSRQEAGDALDLLAKTQSNVIEGSLKPFVVQLRRIENVALIESESHPLVARVEEVVQPRKRGSTNSAASINLLKWFAGASTTIGTIGLGLGLFGGFAGALGWWIDSMLVDPKEEKAIRRAKEDMSKLKAFIKESDQAISVLDDIRRKSIRLSNLILELNSHFDGSTARLLVVIDENLRRTIFDRIVNLFKELMSLVFRSTGPRHSKEHVKDTTVNIDEFDEVDRHYVEEVIGLANVLKRLAATIVVNDEGNVSPEIDHLITHGNKLLSVLNSQ